MKIVKRSTQFIFYLLKGSQRAGAAETTATRVEEQVDGETGHEATRQTHWSRAQEQRSSSHDRGR